MAAESFSKGSTESTIRIAMNNEQIGSAINQPNCSTKIDEIITPTLPKVSANTCKNTPIGRMDQ